MTISLLKITMLLFDLQRGFRVDQMIPKFKLKLLPRRMWPITTKATKLSHYEEVGVKYLPCWINTSSTCKEKSLWVMMTTWSVRHVWECPWAIFFKVPPILMKSIFGIHRIRLTWRWSNTIFHTDGNINVIFFFYVPIHQASVEGALVLIGVMNWP